MADSNIFSVRLDDQDKEKMLALIQESGKSNKEFMSILMNAYELNKTKVDIPDIAKDIEGLQALTQRINEYYINIGKRIEDVRIAKDLRYTKDIEIYKNRIDVLTEENIKITADYQALQQLYDNTYSSVAEYQGQLEQLKQTLLSNGALIKEYKSKIDTLSGIIEEYKGFKVENETTKQLLAAQQADNLQLSNTIKEKDFITAELQKQIKRMEADNEEKASEHNEFVEQLKIKHNQDIETIKEKLDIEKDKAILELKKLHQQELEQIQIKNNKQIEEYQAKYKSLLNELEKHKSTHTNSKKSSNAQVELDLNK